MNQSHKPELQLRMGAPTLKCDPFHELLDSLLATHKESNKSRQESGMNKRIREERIGKNRENREEQLKLRTIE
jgi:hypothetical protein